MSDSIDPNSMNRLPLRAQLLTMRIIWLALLMGPIVFMCVVAWGILPHPQYPIHPQPILVWVVVIMFLTVVPVTFAIRTMIFKGAKATGRVAPAAYLTGNIIFWAGCEGVAFTGLVFAIINGNLWPTILPVAMALGLQAITFPAAGSLYVSEQMPGR